MEPGPEAFNFHDHAMHRRAGQRQAFEANLRQALARNELDLFYQPRIRSADGSLAGVEALLRWLHPDRGLVLPVEFIPLLEDSGFVPELWEWTLGQAARQMAAWHQRGVPVPRVALKLPPRQMNTPDFAACLERILVAAGTPASWVELGVTEAAIMQSPPETLRVLQCLRDRGHQVALNEFGTSHSSLSLLRALPLDILKVDRLGIRHPPGSAIEAALVRAVVTLAGQLGLAVAAEGIETEAQGQLLADLGCDLLQGLPIAPPLPAEHFEAWLVLKEAES